MADKDQDEHTKPAIPRPGQQPDQQQQPNAPPQPDPNSSPQRLNSSQWIGCLPTTGNPDLDPVHGQQRIDLREHNPLTPQGMIFDPRQLIEQQQRQGGHRPGGGLPPGARFDPFGPPDPGSVGPGRGPMPSSQFGDPDPDHFAPPGQPHPPNLRPGGKGLMFPWPPGGGPGFPPPGGAGGSPFL